MTDEWQAAVNRTLHPPDPKDGPFYVKGTIVTGVTQTGINVSYYHRDHLFRLLDDPQPSQWTNSGYQQRARCVNCQEDIPYTDSEFWQVEATKDDIDKALQLVARGQAKLRMALEQLAQIEIDAR